jgi:sialic acid synthase SpsE/mannose-6-phosphate isomerase-like protein (cupin superfamily)
MGLYMNEFNYSELFVLDLANNHQGKVEHGLKIIQKCGEIVRKHNIRAAMKFQFRQLNTFVHPNHKKGSNNKHIPRFLATQLTQAEWKILFGAAKDAGMLTMCTPFDEESVPVITEMGFDIIKVASCSAKDWPLLESIASTFLPVIASTGGLKINDIDNLSSFFEHCGVSYALMHCVSIYPIPKSDFNLNHINTLKKRYSNKTIGWSTHEDPNLTEPIQIAVAKGAQIFERHVGIETSEIKLNAYSSTPEQLDKWFAAYRFAVDLCGEKQQRPITKLEKDSLADLRRGIFIKKNIKKGNIINRDDTYFAMPLLEGQLSSEIWNKGMIATRALKKDEPLLSNDIEEIPTEASKVLKDVIHEVKAMLNEASIVLDSTFKLEFSHHYGVKNFRETGATIINCINRKYCKKLIVVLPGQKHPDHYHKKKEESFQVLTGIFESNIDSHHRTMRAGEIALVQPGVWHNFWSDTGCIVEEVSTTHFKNDSVYNDRKINEMELSERKTIVEHWGRFKVLEI